MEFFSSFRELVTIRGNERSCNRGRVCARFLVTRLCTLVCSWKSRCDTVHARYVELHLTKTIQPVETWIDCSKKKANKKRRGRKKKAGRKNKHRAHELCLADKRFNLLRRPGPFLTSVWPRWARKRAAAGEMASLRRCNERFDSAESLFFFCPEPTDTEPPEKEGKRKRKKKRYLSHASHLRFFSESCDDSIRLGLDGASVSGSDGSFPQVVWKSGL